MSLILANTARKSYLIHFIDTPGHINFVDEVASAVRLVDGILLVVDVVEGVCELFTEGTENFNLFASLWLARNLFLDTPYKRASRLH